MLNQPGFLPIQRKCQARAARLNQFFLACLVPIIALGLLSSSVGMAATAPCGLGDPCTVQGGDYHLLIPEPPRKAAPMPVLLWFHGHRSSGESALKSATIKRVFVDQGFVVVSPNGALRPGTDIRGWPGRANNPYRDDVAFVERVMADVTTRLPIDHDRILVSGFSAGGSMAWQLACFAGQKYRAFAPVAGTLRAPNPVGEACPDQPFDLLHIHGLTDGQVPLEGRTIRDWHQGDVFARMGLARATNGCQSKPTGFTGDGVYRCRHWDGCSSGRQLSLCLHEGGHGLSKNWAEKVYAWFMALPL